jgi:ribonuclease BN (tRNA processing enzyme)
MKLTVVGCSGSYPGPDSPASCYLLEGDDQDGRHWRVLLDLGSGALGTLHRFIDPLDLDGVVFTHLHPDHYFDISGLYVIWKYHPHGARSRIPVWGPPGVAGQLARSYGLAEHPGMTEEFDLREYDEQPVALGPFTIQPVRLNHPIPAYGLRIEAEGKVLAYSGDTGPCPALQDLAVGADLLLCEAAFIEGCDNPENLHLTGRQAGEVATKARVGTLVLTHIPPWNDRQVALAEARESFAGEVALAATGSTYEL